MKRYYKVWFTNGKERTAQLVVDTDKFPKGKTSIETYSRLFPYSEAPKMKTFCTTGLYDSFMEAFHERSKAMDACIPAIQQFYEYDAAGNIVGIR